MVDHEAPTQPDEAESRSNFEPPHVGSMANALQRTLHILIGPKGSGKTFIGSLLQRRLGIPFLRVEDIALAVKRERSHQDESYVREVFGAIEAAVRERLQTSRELVIESTGLTEAFDSMLARLEQDITVNLVRVRAEAETCLRRVKQRDQSVHVDVSDVHVKQINEMVAAKTWPFKGEIDNQAADEAALVTAFESAVGRNTSV
jgi:shikimate kinase